MATLYGTNSNKVYNSPVTVVPPGFFDATVRCTQDVYVGNVIAQNDVVVMGRLPKGAIPLFYHIASTVTFGATATIAIGIVGTTGKYRAAATLAAVSELGMVPAAASVALTAEEQIICTVAAAAGPSSGNLSLRMFYVFN